MSILDGKGSDMPAWRGRISEARLRDLVRYIRGFVPTQKGPQVTSPAAFAKEFRSLQEQFDQLAREGTQPPAADANDDSSSSDVLERLVAWLGKFHPASVNFPIALLVTAALAEVLKLATGKPLFDHAARFCIWVGTLMAAVAALLGWFLGGFQLTDEAWIMTTHRWLGTSAFGCAALVLVLSEVSRRPAKRFRKSFRVTLFGTAVVVLATGFFGGALVFGLDHYAWPP